MRKFITAIIIVIFIIAALIFVYIRPQIIQDENDWTDTSWTYYLGF